MQFTGFPKPPGEPRVPWHRDADHVPLERDAMLTLWLPLVEVPPAPRSHPTWRP